MSIHLDGGESFATLDQTLLQVLTGAETEIELLDGRRRRGRLEDWHPDDGSLVLCDSGETWCTSLRDIRCIQWDGHLAGAPTQTDYRSFAIRFRDGEQLEGMCLECAREAEGVHL
ncbi:MAG TPA: hypothetical protein VLA26_01595, partial [Gammaproteobacteria bacterium]|nr:hypothetical protein [Gammaproteobacteria bacterium]